MIGGVGGSFGQEVVRLVFVLWCALCVSKIQLRETICLLIVWVFVSLHRFIERTNVFGVCRITTK